MIRKQANPSCITKDLVPSSILITSTLLSACSLSSSEAALPYPPASSCLVTVQVWRVLIDSQLKYALHMQEWWRQQGCWRLKASVKIFRVTIKWHSTCLQV